MIRILSDTSTLYSTEQAKQAGFNVAPLSVTIAGKTYREFDEISSKEFVSIIHQGHMPTSSQPAIGEVAALYEQYPNDELLNISMAKGLSSTYDSAVAAKELCDHGDHITVINSRTLCGPHRYIVEKATQMAAEGVSLKEITDHVEELMLTAKSYLIPSDFSYLRQGGRLSPLVSYVGQAVQLAPILTQTEDGCQLTMAAVRRGFKQAVSHVGKLLSECCVGSGWRIYITHADALASAEQALAQLKTMIPLATFEIHPLSPVFITQGGPSCVAIQAIHE